MNRRNEDYGYVDVLTAGAGQNHILQTEIITMFPHTKILPHLHFTEQVLYVIQGNGYSIVDGERIDTRAGEVYHWKAGVTHEMFNPDSIDFRGLLIISPDLRNIDDFLEPVTEELTVSKVEAVEYMCAAAVLL